jgi:hypothetical protein
MQGPQGIQGVAGITGPQGMQGYKVSREQWVKQVPKAYQVIQDLQGQNTMQEAMLLYQLI